MLKIFLLNRYLGGILLFLLLTFYANAQTCPQNATFSVVVSPTPTTACHPITWTPIAWAGYYHVYLETTQSSTSPTFLPVSNMYVTGNSMLIADFGAVIQSNTCYRVFVVPVSRGQHLTQYAQASSTFCMPTLVQQRTACGSITNDIVTLVDDDIPFAPPASGSRNSTPASPATCYNLATFANNGLDPVLHLSLFQQIKTKLATGAVVKFTVKWTTPSGKTGVLNTSLAAGLLGTTATNTFTTMSDADFIVLFNNFIKSDIGKKVKEGVPPSNLSTYCVRFDTTSF
ncbi:MAG: hypothetical protein RI894_2275 [Bacteroidota bacterium]|jgi:hypothetical protein